MVLEALVVVTCGPACVAGLTSFFILVHGFIGGWDFISTESGFFPVGKASVFFSCEVNAVGDAEL